jgi:hypothetical protein
MRKQNVAREGRDDPKASWKVRTEGDFCEGFSSSNTVGKLPSRFANWSLGDQ